MGHQVAAPTSPDAQGWTCTEYATGYRAKVSLVSKSMRVNFAPDELGRDSGLAATDTAVTQLGYNVYFPAPGYETLKLPGFPKAIGIQTGVRAPGWNTVCAGSRYTINGVDCGPATPSDIGCYVDSAGPHPEFVYLNSFAATRGPAIEAAGLPPAVPGPPRFRFASRS